MAIYLNEKRNKIKEVKEEVKDDFFDKFVESKWSKIIAIILVAFTLMSKVTEKPLDVRLGYKVGDYIYTHRSYGEPVYRLVTPRGPEWVRGYKNLMTSIEVYAETGVEGEDYRSLKTSIYPSTSKSLEEIEEEVKLQNKEVEEFNKEFFNE